MSRVSKRRGATTTPSRRPAQAPLRYRVAMPEPQSHELQVTMEIPALPDRPLLRFGMPAWAPGSYMVRDFARHVYDLAVTDLRGRPLPTERLDKQRWGVASGGQARARPLPGVRLRGDRAHLVLRRQPRLLERHQRVLLRRGRAGPPVSRWTWCPARGWQVSTALPPVARPAPPLPGRRLRRAGRLAVRGRRRTRCTASGWPGIASRWRCSGAPTPTSPACCATCARSSSAGRRSVRRLPLRSLPVHRARPGGARGRAGARRLRHPGHRRPGLRGRQVATSASPSWRRTSSSTPGTSSASATGCWGRSTTPARTTPACCGSTRASPNTWRASCCCGRGSSIPRPTWTIWPRTGPSTWPARAAT